MWKVISDQTELDHFLNAVCCFHDSCIKEMNYQSGAYVDRELSMYPINDRRALRVVFQRQYADSPVIELEFSGLRFLKLYPISEDYTCEIIEATMIFKDGFFYWYDCGKMSEDALCQYEGTVICASHIRWRARKGGLGRKNI